MPAKFSSFCSSDSDSRRNFIASTHLPERDNPLARSHDTALEHDEVLFDLTVMLETAHRVDGLVGVVVLSRSVVRDQLSVNSVKSVSDAVYLLVDLSSAGK